MNTNVIKFPKNKEEICRFCLTTEGQIVNSLFDNNEATKLHEILKIINLNILHDENLPSSICDNCKQQVDLFFMFRSMIEDNEKLLKNTYPMRNNIILEDSLCNDDNVCDDFIEDVKLKKKVIEKITCDNCNKLVKKTLMKRHKIKCMEKVESESEACDAKEYICNMCGELFPNDVKLSLHYIQHAMYDAEKIDLFLFCNFCGCILNSNDEYFNHILSKHSEFSEKKWSCKTCNSEYKTEFLLLKHIHCTPLCKIVNNDSDLCLICKQHVENLLDHVKTHLLKRYSCTICKEKYITITAFNNHLKMHPQYKYKCPHCLRMFLSKKNIDKHIKEIHNSDQYVCEICSKIFNRKHNLTLHKRQKHDDKNKNFICSICAYATRSNSDLRKHERLHSNERPFECTFNNCNKAYKSSSHLSYHMKTHLNIRNFLCEFCDKSFYTSKNLKHHILEHTGVKDFKCQLCEQAFKRRDQLNAHIKRHTCIC